MAGSAKRGKTNDDGKAKKISPYFNFCTLNRAKVKESNPQTPVNKALSMLWKSLSDKEKAAYGHPDPPPLTIPAELQKQDEEPSADNNNIAEIDDGDDNNGEIEEAVNNSSAPLFPLTRVLRIMKLDRDIGKVNRDVRLAVAIATENFVQLLAEAAFRIAVEKKHKTIRFDHVVTAVSRQKRFADFLEDSIAYIGKGGADHSEDEKEEEEEEEGSSPKPSKKSGRARPPPPPGTRSITDFFASKAAPPSSDS
ncbi:hypothetical protein SUGI_0059050 [Cryptomeria japonica]|uniref:uncharacterized protein LOC131064159 n=1 Tax=Cryptomeria japonica TaxID=3369 RepID=UPI002408DD81|nr:uncharacterized protein LOC131064159 [Cryptomeria japonica]GLJ07124.1 hypothetical protein SUGI_0059050 [Cryptomeria japonica]